MNSAQAAIVVVMLLCTACTSHKFTMQQYALVPTQGVKLVNKDKITLTAVNAFRMNGPSKVGLRAQRQTELIFSTEIIRSSLDRIIIQTRTTPFDDSTSARKGISFIIEGDSTTIVNGEDSVTCSTPLPVGKPFLFTLLNNGAWFDVVIGHKMFGYQRTELANTEWFLIAVPGQGSILVGDPQFNISSQTFSQF